MPELRPEEEPCRELQGGAAVQPGVGGRRARQALSARKGAVRGLGLRVLPGPHPLFHSRPLEPLPHPVAFPDHSVIERNAID